MKYLILLHDCTSGREAQIECPANMVLEELSAKIKVELQLPYVDHGDHRFLCKGKTYVIDEHVESEPEMIWEVTRRDVKYYRSSERMRLNKCFTVLGSSVTYQQKRMNILFDNYKVRCTLVARMPRV